MDTVVYKGTTYTYEHVLNNHSGPELVKLFNELAPAVGKEKTKRFGDKVAGAKRVWEALKTVSPVVGSDATVASAPSEQAKADKPVEPEAPKPPKKARDPKPAKEKKERAPRGKYFMFPSRGKDEIKEIKEKTMRGTLYRLMSRSYGATFEQLYEATWAAKVADGSMDEETANKTTYEAIRLVHYFNGFGIYHAENEHLFVWATQAELAEIKREHPPKTASKA